MDDKKQAIEAAKLIIEQQQEKENFNDNHPLIIEKKRSDGKFRKVMEIVIW